MDADLAMRVDAVCGRGVGDEVRDLELNRPVPKVPAR